MALETSPWDPAEHMTGVNDVFYFLEAELEEDEPSYWPGAFAIVARARGGFEKLAEETSLPVEDLQRAADEKDVPNREVMVKVMEAYRRRMGSESRVA